MKVRRWFGDYWPSLPIIIALVLLAVFLFKDPEGFQNLAWYGLVALTAIYAWATLMIARANKRTIEEMEQSRLDAVKPSLSLQLGFSTEGAGLNELFLVNSGGVAKDVKIDIDTATPEPRRLLVTAIDREHWVYLGTPAKAQDQSGMIVVSLQFKDGYGQTLTDSVSIDTATLKKEGRDIIGQYSDLREIQRTLKQMVSEAGPEKR